MTDPTPKEPTASCKEVQQVTEMELGFAGKLAQAFIHSPLSPLLFAVMMLLGDDARWVTGQVIEASGGLAI